MSDPAAIAEQFLAARRSANALREFPGALPDSLDGAYAIQDAAIARWSRPIVGWKIGRVLPPYSERFGTDRLAGPIFTESRAEPGRTAEMEVFEGGFAAGEAEFLLRIGRTPPAGKARFTLGEAADLIDRVQIGMEIASSPLATINELGPTAVVSDFGNNNGLLIGEEVPDWRYSGFEDWTVSLSIGREEVGSGTAAAFPDGAIGAARFLFELMALRGVELQQGQWISSGAVGGVHPARAGQIVEAWFASLPPLRCRLVPAQGAR